MEQPQDMAGLLRSVIETQRNATHSVVPTLATRSMDDLTTTNRAIARQYLLAAQATAMAVESHEAGATVAIRQTDEYYRSTDHNGTARRLIAHVEFLGQRSR